MSRSWVQRAFLLAGLIASIIVGIAVNALSDGASWLTLILALVVTVPAAAISFSASYQPSKKKKKKKKKAKKRRRKKNGWMQHSGDEPDDEDEDEDEDILRVDDHPSRLTASLLLGLRDVEVMANDMLRDESPDRALSLFELRARLKGAGIWNDEDVKAFDRAVSVRNRLVHGASSPPGGAQIRAALGDVNRVLDRLREGERPSMSSE